MQIKSYSESLNVKRRKGGGEGRGKLEVIFKTPPSMHRGSDLERQHFMKEKINKMCGAPIMKQDELIRDACHHGPSSF